MDYLAFYLICFISSQFVDPAKIKLDTNEVIVQAAETKGKTEREIIVERSINSQSIKVKIGQIWVNVKSFDNADKFDNANPFEKPTYDTLYVMDVKAGYVQYCYLSKYLDKSDFVYTSSNTEENFKFDQIYYGTLEEYKKRHGR